MLLLVWQDAQPLPSHVGAERIASLAYYLLPRNIHEVAPIEETFHRNLLALDAPVAADEIVLLDYRPLPDR